MYLAGMKVLTLIGLTKSHGTLSLMSASQSCDQHGMQTGV